jgi:membrane protein
VASVKERVASRVEEVRERRPFVDHVVRMVQHYGTVEGNMAAGAVTYFAFLSFFPVLALGFFVVGYIAKVVPEVQDTLVTAIQDILPGIIGPRETQLSLTEIQDAAGAVGLVGVAGVLYAGLGWVSSMRGALRVVFRIPVDERLGLVAGKLRDLGILGLLGTVMVVSVGVSSGVSFFSKELLELVGLGAELAPLLQLLTIVLGLAASTVLFYVLFLLPGGHRPPSRSLWAGALLGAVGFELLKRLSAWLLGMTQGQPAFQAFGIALILVVWINYFSRVVMYAAAWAYTAPEARAERDALQADEDARELLRLERELQKAARERERDEGLRPSAAAGLGAAAMLGAVAAARRTVRKKETRP